MTKHRDGLPEVVGFKLPQSPQMGFERNYYPREARVGRGRGWGWGRVRVLRFRGLMAPKRCGNTCGKRRGKRCGNRRGVRRGKR